MSSKSGVECVVERDHATDRAGFEKIGQWIGPELVVIVVSDPECVSMERE